MKTNLNQSGGTPPVKINQQASRQRSRVEPVKIHSNKELKVGGGISATAASHTEAR